MIVAQHSAQSLAPFNLTVTFVNVGVGQQQLVSEPLRVPSRARTPQNASEYLASRSRIRYRLPRRKPSPMSMTLRAICVIHALSGCGVMPATWTDADTRKWYTRQ